MRKPFNTIVLWITLALFTLTVQAADASQTQRPNFIFILSDDIAQGDLGSYGQQLIKTPRLDQLASEGTRSRPAKIGS